MKYGKRIIPTLLLTNVTDESYPAFDNTASCIEFNKVIYQDNIYSANTNIYPLATYSWNQIEPSEDGQCIRLEDKAVITSASVPVVKDITTVYVIDTYKDTTGTADGKFFRYIGNESVLDFNEINPAHPDWKIEVNLRYIDIIPPISPLYWKDEGAVNSKRHLDGKIFSQTVLESGTTITNYYQIPTSDFLNAIVFFNLKTTNIKITILDLDDNILESEQIIDTIDYQDIMTPYDWFFTPMPEGGSKNTLFTTKPYSNCKVKIEYYYPSHPAIGETIFTRLQDVGQTANKPTGRKKNFDKITIDPDTGIKTRIKNAVVIDEVNYNVYVPVEELDSRISLWTSILNEDIVVIGDETGTYSNLVHYCYIQELPYEIDTDRTMNTYQITLTTLA